MRQQFPSSGHLHGNLRLLVLTALGACVLATSTLAQQPATPPPAPTLGGSVTGRVVCGDTQAPARFAAVSLISVAEVSGGEDDFSPRRNTARTDLDGVYTATGVAPGDYYVTASATGYVSESAALQAASRNGADIQPLLAQLPIVHVSGGGSATANITLERGATIAGKVVWDDGSPATGVSVSVVTPPASTIASAAASQQRAPQGFGGFGGGAGFAATDDRGLYRLTGLASGDYLVRANMPIPSTNSGGRGGFGATAAIQIYAPGKIRMTDAKPLSIRAGDERDDVLITLDLRSLHTVSGHVSSASDTVSLGSGTIRITDQQDATLTRSANLAADGSFSLTYVPNGTYTLSVPNASSSTAATFFGGRRGGSSSGGTSFQPLTQTITVTDTDVSGLTISLAPASTQAQTAAH